MANAAGKAALLLACLAWSGGAAALAKQGTDGAGSDAGSYLPASMQPKEDLYLAVLINGYETRKLAQFRRYADGCLTIAPENLKAFNLKVPESALHASGGVCLERMPGLTYRYDVTTQSIYLKVSDDARVPADFEVRKSRPAVPTTQNYPVSAVLNYSLFASGGTENYQYSYYPQYQGASATLDGRVFWQYGFFEQSFTANSTQTDLTPYFLRLDTRWLYENPDTLMTYAAGDIISGSLNWTTSIRMGGVQIRRDFSLRPDLVTQPMPQFSASAAVPSTVEVYANQARTFSQEITGGPFNINNIPLNTGPGTMRIVLRDATGKETVTEYSYYNSTSLLAPGLFDYSLESGFARQFYGLYSNEYDGAPIASGSFRYGLTPRITIEGHAEGGAGLVNLGGGADFGLWHYGVASLAFSGSEWNGAFGGQVYGSFETTVWGARFMARALQSLGDYEDLAFVTAPKCSALIIGCTAGTGAPFRNLEEVSLSIPLGFDPSTISLSYTGSEDYEGNRYKLGTLSYSRPFYWDRSTISLNVFNDFEHKNSYGAYASLTFSWDKYTASAIAEAGSNGNGNNNSYAAGGSFSRALGSEPGSYGYSLTGLEGPAPYNSASAAYRAPAFVASASVTEAGKTTQATGQLDGSIAILNGVHFANRIDNTFAVVDTGIPDARVLYQNNPIGETGPDGTLLIASLRAHEYNTITIDPASLPPQADMPETKQVVVPAQKGGISVHFKGNASPPSAVVTFKDDVGQYLPAGSEVWVNGNATSFGVGYDGETYLTGLALTNTVKAKKPNGTPCSATFEFTPNPKGQVRISDVVCHGDGAVMASMQTGGITVRAKQ
jgi:outer membrane usher protein